MKGGKLGGHHPFKALVLFALLVNFVVLFYMVLITPPPPEPGHLFTKHNHVTPFKAGEEPPQVCIAVLSCRRLNYLRQTLTAVINYFARVEPWVTYEIALVDNDSGDDTVKAILEEFPIEKVALLRKNYGITYGINLNFFGLCSAPYILSVEDDWEARWETWDAKVPAISMSISILNHDPQALEIWLRDVDHKHISHQVRSDWNFINATTTLPQIQYKKQYQGEGTWGTYTNGASLKRKVSLLHAGQQISLNGEKEYADRTAKLGYVSIIMCFLYNGCDEKYATTNDDLGLFAHLGYKRSPGRKDFE